MAHSISREKQLEYLNRCYDDSGIMYLAATIFNTSSYQLIRSAMLTCDGYSSDADLDDIFQNIHMTIGKIESRYRQYLIDIILGDKIFIPNATPTARTALLRA